MNQKMTISKRHPAYKDSGIEWLGEVPEEWDVHRIKYRVDTNAKSLPEDTDPDYCFRYVDIGNVDQGHITFSPETIFFAEAPSRARRIAVQGDTIVSTVRTYLKAIAFVDYTGDDLVVSTGFAVLTPRKSDIPKYVYYLMSCEKVIDAICSLSVGVSYPAINSSDLTSIPLWFPPKREQQAITVFLDKKTALIDNLIAKKQRQIELLKEQRQAVINQAVTKGLDPKVEMKDSGIEWLGDIPKHWKVVRLKYLGKAIIGLTYSPDNVVQDETEGVLVLRASNIQNGKLSLEDNVYVNAVIPSELITKYGDILICSRSGSRNLIGKCICIDNNIKGCTFGAFMTVFRSQSWRYLSKVLISALFTSQAGLYLTSTINQLTVDTLNNLVVAIPPSIEEQHAIANFLDQRVKHIDNGISKAEGQIQFLQEYRTALISEAVTGKIDVRNG